MRSGKSSAADGYSSWELKAYNRSTTGYANVYGPDASSGIPDTGATRPHPLKALGNLTTSVTTLRFNSDAQLLAIGSDAKKDQLRLVRAFPSSFSVISEKNAFGTCDRYTFPPSRPSQTGRRQVRRWAAWPAWTSPRGASMLR